MLLPTTTIIVAAVVASLLIILVVAAALVYCKKRKDTSPANSPEELDRFLNDESEDEKFIGGEKQYKSSVCSFDEGSFHFVDVEVEGNESGEQPTETGDAVTLDAVVIENDSTDECVLQDAPEGECVVVEYEAPAPDDCDDIAEQLSESVESLDIEPDTVASSTIEVEITEPVVEITADPFSDDASVLSDPEQSIAIGTNETTISRTKRRTRSLLSSTFAVNAKLKISLQYMESVKCLKGNIKAIEGLDFQSDHCPTDINFHMRLFPSKRFHMASKYKSVVDDTSLNLSFTMGPITQEDLANSKLRVKLYGKKANRLTRSKCYGESSYDLREIIGKTEPIDFEENVLERPVGSVVYSSDSDVGLN